MSRRGFTLIELLVTVTVIGILMSLTLMALHGARESTREAKTKATITKLHNLLMQRWDSYHTRRLPIYLAGEDPSDAAAARLNTLRQIMRLEMPQRWAEVTAGPTMLTRNPSDNTEVIPRPAVSQAYLRFHAKVSPTPQFEGAECLYMIITMGLMDEGIGRELFSEDEIGDVDGDGAPEFIDGWGVPIRFLRWAPAFASPLQPVNPNTGQPNPFTNHDPFDVQRIEIEAHALYPLIYSAGPDKIFDIRSAEDGNPNHVTDNPFINQTELDIGKAEDLDSFRDGAVVPANGEFNDTDNITNHMLATGLR